MNLGQFLNGFVRDSQTFWTAAILLLVLYIADGVFMIVGDIVRAHKAAKAKKWVRRKPLPYATAGLVNDAIMANTEAQRALKALITKNGADALQQAALASPSRS